MPRRVRHPNGPCCVVGPRLRRLSEWAVASCLTAAFGCTDAPGVLRQPLTDSPLRRVPCGDLLLATDPIHPARALDYIGMFQPSAGFTRVVTDYGDACTSACDQVACLADLATALARVGCAADAGICEQFAITTQGDKVQRHDDPSTLVGLLGAIDTHSEAVLVAELYGLQLRCSWSDTDPDNPGTRVQPTPTGYHLESKWDECSETVGDQSIEIQRDGSSNGLDKNMIVRSGCVVGRRPAGLQLSAAHAAREPLAAFLAECAKLEAASVPAFRRLARDLDRLGARRLARVARRSAREEIRHAVQMRGLANRYGARPSAPRVAAAQRLRTALEIAQENAVEGCVRETFGALVAWQQSACAKDPLVARTMRSIAADETRHAELSWQIAAWLEPKLSARERASVQRARHKALNALHREIDQDPLSDSARAQIGWPSNSRQHALLQRLATELDIG